MVILYFQQIAELPRHRLWVRELGCHLNLERLGATLADEIDLVACHLTHHNGELAAS